jgi:calcineurin-like phosphoesterase family protein
MLRTLKINHSEDDIFFYSDLHIHHDRDFICKPRGFTSVVEHDKTLIERWNDTVKDTSVVFHLGDIIFKSDENGFWQLMAKLRFGHLYLMLGNHVSGQKQAYQIACAGLPLQPGQEVYPLTALTWDDRPYTYLPEYIEIEVNKQSMTLCHYPIASWHHVGHGNIHLHGHCHGSLKEKLPRRLDVGVESVKRPISLKEINVMMRGMEPALVDHHGKDTT